MTDNAKSRRALQAAPVSVAAGLMALALFLSVRQSNTALAEHMRFGVVDPDVTPAMRAALERSQGWADLARVSGLFTGLSGLALSVIGWMQKDSNRFVAALGFVLCAAVLLAI